VWPPHIISMALVISYRLDTYNAEQQCDGERASRQYSRRQSEPWVWPDLEDIEDMIVPGKSPLATALTSWHAVHPRNEYRHS